MQALWLEMIAAARRCIYIENQYFTSHVLCEALAARLAEPEGPEIVAVLRLATTGWLESPTMGTLRSEALRRLQQADRHGHFRAFYPYIPGLEECCDLHAKLLIVDDEWLRIGSANFCNRSMSLDTECDVTLEARGQERVRSAIRAFRNRLLGEHLAVAPEAIGQAVTRHGSLLRGIESQRHGEGRTLRPFAQVDEPSVAALALAGIADPEKPVSLEHLVDLLGDDEVTASGGPRWLLLLVGVLALLGFAALWRYTPLAELTDADLVAQYARRFAEQPWAPLVIVLAYIPVSLTLFPRPLLTLAAVIAFGPWMGFVYALTGILLAGYLTFLAGRSADRTLVRRLAGERLDRVANLLRRRGLLAMTAVRLVPLAPFAVVNLVAGGLRVRHLQFLGGTALGVLPGLLAAAVFGDQLMDGLRDPRSMNLWLVAAALLFMVGCAWGVRRWVLREERPAQHARR